MAGYRLSRPARRDLADIWLYIAEDNPEAADTLIDRLYEKFMLLGAMPNAGRDRSDLVPDLRSLPVADYLIFYRVTGGGVEIVRVIHGARDMKPLLSNDQK